MSTAPTILPIVLIFAGSALACLAAFLASYAMEEGLPIPSINWGALFPAAPPAGPVWCESARRWRDPVTLRFVKAPR